MAKPVFKKNNRKTAIVFGSSGLVGKALVEQLFDFADYREVLCVNRKKQAFENSKYREIISDFSDLEKISDDFKGSEVFCCLGTTINKAGSKEKFREVDFELVLTIGKLAERNRISRIFVVSSLGADAKTRNFYLQTKGQMEQGIEALKIEHKTIVRPSMLLGQRNEKRLGESVGKVVMKIVHPILMGKIKKYRAIHADDVAKAMIIIANSSPTQQVIFESNELQEIADGGM